MNASIVVAGLALAGALLPAEAQAQSWKTLATLSVQRSGESTAVVQTNRQPFRHIRLCAQQRPVQVSQVVIRFDNGNRQTASFRRTIGRNTCASPITLRTQDSPIRSINLKHAKIRPGNARPTVRVQAR
jgi:hypothetical protein